MRGSLQEFGLLDVLQVVGVSRQHTVIELHDREGKRRGAIALKAGQVLSAEHAGAKGLSAFFELFDRAPDLFHVFRLPDTSAYPEPLGPLTRLLLEAGDLDSGWGEPEMTQADEAELIFDEVESDQTSPGQPAPPSPGRGPAISTAAPTPARSPAPLPPPAAAKPEPARPLAQGSGVSDLPGKPPLAAVPKRSEPARPTPVAVRSRPPTESGRPTPHIVRRSPATKPPLGPVDDVVAARGRKSGEREHLVVAVASPKGGVGKTTITINLALSLAERGVRTVVVDADINGDILSALDARERATVGSFDLLDEPEKVAEALRSTAAENLRILPACGQGEVPLEALNRPDLAAAWQRLMDHVRPQCDITLIDCPAGMFQTTSAVLRACTHVVGVFQAEILSSRSFSMFLRGLAAVPQEQRPALAGVVVNMFQGRADGSIEAFHSICNDGERHKLFDTTIPRSEAFGQATMIGKPLRVAGEEASPIAFLFDMLAEEVCHRVGVRKEDRDEPQAFVL